ncbi:hypothetical protein L7F22_029991 [Adiantum nelumboides]|nr:hypothetical protein [Adiantum nelumboides]
MGDILLAEDFNARIGAAQAAMYDTQDKGFRELDPCDLDMQRMAQVPTGLELGVSTMTRMEKSLIFVCRSHLTEASAIPSLPKDVEEIQFEVEIVQIIQVRDLVGDGRVVKHRIRDGKGEFPMDCPLQDCVMRIHYKGYLSGAGGLTFYDSRKDREGGEPVVFGSDEGLVPEGLEMCVKLMLPGELARVSSTSEYAYDKFKRPDLVPEGADVQWEVELLDFKKAKDWTGLTFQEIMNDADKIKAIGNRLFKEEKYNLSKAKYEKMGLIGHFGLLKMLI